MKCYLDENNNVLSESELKSEYSEYIKTLTDGEEIPSFYDYIDNCVNHACSLTEVKLSENISNLIHDKAGLEINLLYVDKQELPSMLTALIKQNLYRWNNEKIEDGCSIEAAKEHVLAEIEKTRRVAKSLNRLLSILKSLYDVKYESSKAYNIAVDCDIKTDLLGQIGAIDDNMEEEIASVIYTIGKLLEVIVPGLNSDNVEWFSEDSEYIDVLLKWSEDLKIELL